MEAMTLLHGSNHIIEQPQLRIGQINNDYGRGFYCTQDRELAREWACKNDSDGYVNRYTLQGDQLCVLNLLDEEHSILNWIALLVRNRKISVKGDIAPIAQEYFLKHFCIDLSGYDAVIGYRADDSYFAYAEAFVNNTLALRSLNKALRLGDLGEQVALVSEKAFERLAFVDAEPVAKEIYYPRFMQRDAKARNTYREEVRGSQMLMNDIFILDIIRGEMRNGDSRIQRSLLE